MDWVEHFYTQQDEWARCYSRDITETDRARASAIERCAGGGSKRVLELGAGGGQCAVVAAEHGHRVVAIELVPRAAAHARALGEHLRQGELTVLQADFYTVELPDQFDVVCYWDGFGIGTDGDQRRLLARIASWLAPSGCALIDINTPWYWAQAVGQEMRFGDVVRRYGFDALECRLLDRWWPIDDEQAATTQSLRCYSPADLQLLLHGTGLAIQAVEPGGAVDYAAQQYREHVPLEQAMQYMVHLVPVAPAAR